MTARFLKACDFVLRWETVFKRGHYGDYAYAVAEHDPDDPGGTTKFGIDQRSHPEVDIERLTVDRARQIYALSYWGAVHAEALPLGLGEAAFDAGVNCGVGRAAVWLQEVLAAAGCYHGAIDGRIGPQTLAAARKSNRATVTAYLFKRRSYYDRLVVARPSMKKYHKGWLRRIDDLARFIDQASV